MEKPTEDQIRQRAHEIWEHNHRPNGREEEFWHQAEKELLNEGGGSKGSFDTPDVLPGMISARYVALTSMCPTVILLRWLNDTRAGLGQQLERSRFEKV